MRYGDIVRRSGKPGASRCAVRSPLQRAADRPMAAPMALGDGEKRLFHVVAELQPANLVKLDSGQAPA